MEAAGKRPGPAIGQDHHPLIAMYLGPVECQAQRQGRLARFRSPDQNDPAAINGGAGRVKAVMDPAGLLNPGRMRAGQ